MGSYIFPDIQLDSAVPFYTSEWLHQIPSHQKILLYPVFITFNTLSFHCEVYQNPRLLLMGISSRLYAVSLFVFFKALHLEF